MQESRLEHRERSEAAVRGELYQCHRSVPCNAAKRFAALVEKGALTRPRRSERLLEPPAKTNHFIPCSNLRASPSNALICLRSAIASPVNRPRRRAFWFPPGAPDPGAPPCMRQRLLPRTAGERHDPQQRVFAPQRGLARIGPILRA
jgi:hypothetical protein